MSVVSQKPKLAIFHNLPGGGGIRMLENIILKYKRKYDIDLYVISDKKPKESVGVETKFVQVEPWKGFFLKNLWIIFKLPLIHKELANTINRSYGIILVTHDYFTKSPYLLRYLKINNIYLCQEPQREFYEPWRVHAPELKEKIANILRLPIKYIDRINTRSANKIICNSKYSKITIEKIYGRKSSIIYPGVDERFFIPNKSKKENIILCIGGINPVKDQSFLSFSLKSILNKYKLILVGQGKTGYINKVLRLGGHSPNIVIINKISDEKLRFLYRKAMVTCISAYKEPFGLSSLESQSCGTPVVAINEGGPTETIVNNKTGYLVNKDSNEFLKKVLLAIKNNKILGINARKNIIEKWSWEKTLDKLDKFL